MSISIYTISVPPYRQMLSSLDFVLERASEFAREQGINEGDLMQRRFAHDMFTLAEQIRHGCMQLSFTIARLAGVDAPDVQMEPDTNIADARTRVAETLAFINSVKPEQMEGDPERVVDVKTRLAALKFGALEHLVHYANPQVYFHMTTIYDLLRAEGVQIGKGDFLGHDFKAMIAAATKLQ